MENHTRYRDTLILNGNLAPYPVETNLLEEQVKNDSLQFTFNLIRQYLDQDGKVINSDTVEFQQVSLALNELNKKHLVKNCVTFRVCLFAPNVAVLLLDKNRTATIPRTDSLARFFVGAYELKGFKEFKVVNPKSNKFTINEIYKESIESKIRSVKYLIKGKNQIYVSRNRKGSFEKDNFWWGDADKLTLQK